MIGDSRLAYIDSSILGIGRIPGNLCTELITNYFNLILQQEKYNLNEIYKLIDDPISEIRKSKKWGYMPAYAITAFKKTHRSYAEYLMEKPELNLKDIDIILSQINSDKDRKNFNESVIESLYKEFINKPIKNEQYY